jgi:hypothetical protein
VSLYKYLPPERVDVISTRRIRYSQPVVFNDPFEAKPYCKGIAPEEAIFQICEKAFQEALPDSYQNLSVEIKEKLSYEQFLLVSEVLRPSIVHDNFLKIHESNIPKANELIHDTFGTKIGVLSLSEIKDNLLMWSHYSEGHTGFVLELDETHNFFGGRKNDSDEIWGLHKVRYADERPQTVVSELNMTAILMTKGKPWEYEYEWRAFRPLNQCAVKIDAQPYPVFLFDFPTECIRSVIFGARMTDATRESIFTSVENNPAYAHIKLFQAVIDKKKYALHMVPIFWRDNKFEKRSPHSSGASSL